MSDTSKGEDAPGGLAKDIIEKAEGMDESGAPLIEQARQQNPEATEAAEQEAKDGPEGRGLSR